MRIAVTGATGHIGINLVKALVSQNYKVKVLVHNNTSDLSNYDVDIIVGDLLNPKSLIQLCKDVDIVIHLAAVISIGLSSSNDVYNINVQGTKNIVDVAIGQGVKKLIHFSSIHAIVQEPLNKTLDEKGAIAFDSKIPYEVTKATAEQWVLNQQSNTFDVVVLSPTSVIGPEDPGPSLMGEFMCGAFNRTIPGVVPGGYDWVDVRDIVDATITAISKGKGGNKYILSGAWLSIKEFADLWMNTCGSNRRLPVIPLWLAKFGVPFLYVFAKLTRTKPVYTNESLSILQSGNRQISSLKAQTELGFHSRALEETFIDSHKWYKENKYI